MSLLLDGTTERPGPRQTLIVDCSNASFIFRYASGFVVTLRGHLSGTLGFVRVVNLPNPSLRFELLQFEAKSHDKHQPFVGKPPSDGASATLNGATGMKSEGDDDMGLNAMGKPKPSPASGSEGGADVETVFVDPVNSFGIPHPAMRCLELAESVYSLQELFNYAEEDPGQYSPIGASAMCTIW